ARCPPPWRHAAASRTRRSSVGAPWRTTPHATSHKRRTGGTCSKAQTGYRLYASGALSPQAGGPGRPTSADLDVEGVPVRTVRDPIPGSGPSPDGPNTQMGLARPPNWVRVVLTGPDSQDSNDVN